jgi:hypothetical protein
MPVLTVGGHRGRGLQLCMNRAAVLRKAIPARDLGASSIVAAVK